MPIPLTRLATLGLVLAACAASSSAQCHEQNMGCPRGTQTTGNYWAVHCRSSTALTITGVSFSTRPTGTTANGLIELWLADSAGLPTQRVATGSIQMNSAFTIQRGCFSQPYSMPANQDFAVVFRLSGAYEPLCTSGTNVTYHWRRNSVEAWRGPFQNPLAFRLECTTCRPPQQGSYATFGMGCPGTPPAPACCESNMTCGGSSSFQTVPSLFYALRCAVVTARDITGVTLRTNSTSGTAVGRVELWQADGSGAPTVMLSSARIVIGPTYGNYTATFTRPVHVPGGSSLAVVFSLSNAFLPDCTGATPSTHYQRTGSFGPWQGPFNSLAWAYRLECTNIEGLSPQLFAGVPMTGSTFGVTLSGARPNTGAVLVFGGSKSSWGPFPLPFNLGVLGAPLCSLDCSLDLTVGALTDAQGIAQVSVQVPADPGLVGSRFCNQWLVLDPGANAADLVVSACGDALVGG